MAKTRLFLSGLAITGLAFAACDPVSSTPNKNVGAPVITTTTTTQTQDDSATVTLPPTTDTTVASTTTTLPAPPPTAAPTTAAPRTVTTAHSQLKATGNQSAVATSGGSASGGKWACIIQRESGGNPHVGSGGLYGILPSTWRSLGYSGTAGGADVGTQTQAALRLQAKYGWQPWSPYDGC